MAPPFWVDPRPHRATGRISYCGLHGMARYAFVLHLLRPGGHLADIGANVGSYTVLASPRWVSQHCGLEPTADTFAWRQRNLALKPPRRPMLRSSKQLRAARGTVFFRTTRDCMNQGGRLATAATLQPVEVSCPR